MFDWMLPEKHAIAILKKDHDTVKGLFDELEKAKSPAAKDKIIGQAVTELKIHSLLEEEIFYPTVRAHVGSELMNEAMAKELDIDFEALGQKMLDRKKDLQKNGIPPDAEHAMVAKAHGEGDSPAVAAKRRKAPTARKSPVRSSSRHTQKRGSHASR